MATQPQLVMQTGPNPGKEFSLEKPDLTIGRDIANDIVINDAEVSRKHARIFVQGDQYYLEDLGSTNGTFVNGQRIAGVQELNSGDSIQMGENVTVLFEAAQYDPDATAVMPAKKSPSDTVAAMPDPEPMFEHEPVDPNQTMADEPVFSPPPVEKPVFSPPPVAAPINIEPPVLEDPIFEETPAKKNNKVPIIAGCGCLAVLFCMISTWLLWVNGDRLLELFGF